MTLLGNRIDQALPTPDQHAYLRTVRRSVWIHFAVYLILAATIWVSGPAYEQMNHRPTGSVREGALYIGIYFVPQILISFLILRRYRWAVYCKMVLAVFWAGFVVWWGWNLPVLFIFAIPGILSIYWNYSLLRQRAAFLALFR